MTPDPKPIEAMKPCPKPLYSCHCCYEDYSFPASDLHWSENVKQWICENCWWTEEHGEEGVTLEKYLAATRTPDLDAEGAAMREALEECTNCFDNMDRIEWTGSFDQGDYRAAKEAVEAALASTAGAELLERLKRAEGERDALKSEVEQLKKETK